MKKLIYGILLFSFSVSSVAKVQSTNWDDYYAGLQFSQISMDVDDSDAPTSRPFSLSAIVGQDLNEFFAIEARLGIGVADDSQTFVDQDSGIQIEFDTEVEYAFSLVAKPKIQFNERLSGYALIGWSRAEMQVESDLASNSGAENGLSYGFGFELESSDRLSFYLDWLQLMDEDLMDLSSINLGMRYYFN